MPANILVNLALPETSVPVLLLLCQCGSIFI